MGVPKVVTGASDHYGRAELVTLGLERGEPVFLDRRQASLIDPELPIAPYHHEAAELELAEAERPDPGHLLDGVQGLDGGVEEPCAHLVAGFGPVVTGSFDEIGLGQGAQAGRDHRPVSRAERRSSASTSSVAGRPSPHSMPSAMSWRIAGRPAAVAGTLIIAFGRSSAAHRRRASATVPSVSFARCGDTSRLTTSGGRSTGRPTGVRIG